MLARPTVFGGSVSERQAGPGDILCTGESFIAGPSADANSTLTAAMIAAGIINRTGMTAGRTDTTDTVENVLTALGGNDFDRNVIAGNTFRFKYFQNQAFATTWAHGRGWVAGALGGALNVAASTWRSFICKILCAAKEKTLNCGTTNASAAVTLDVAQNAGTIVPGMLVTGAGITAGTKVAGVTYGNSTTRADTDKICAITLDANATATAASGVSLIFSPVIEISSDGSGTL
jgi:hypothetical protein